MKHWGFGKIEVESLSIWDLCFVLWPVLGGATVGAIGVVEIQGLSMGLVSQKWFVFTVWPNLEGVIHSVEELVDEVATQWLRVGGGTRLTYCTCD